MNSCERKMEIFLALYLFMSERDFFMVYSRGMKETYL